MWFKEINSNTQRFAMTINFVLQIQMGNLLTSWGSILLLKKNATPWIKVKYLWFPWSYCFVRTLLTAFQQSYWCRFRPTSSYIHQFVVTQSSKLRTRVWDGLRWHNVQVSTKTVLQFPTWSFVRERPDTPRGRYNCTNLHALFLCTLCR
jgi:hypothetical protein